MKKKKLDQQYESWFWLVVFLRSLNLSPHCSSRWYGGRKKQNKKNGISPDVLKSSAQLRLHGESGKFDWMFCQLCLPPQAATSALFACGGGSVCKVMNGCFSHNVGMLTPDKRSFFISNPPQSCPRCILTLWHLFTSPQIFNLIYDDKSEHFKPLSA